MEGQNEEILVKKQMTVNFYKEIMHSFILNNFYYSLWKFYGYCN